MDSLSQWLVDQGLTREATPLELIERELRAVYVQLSTPNSERARADALRRFAAELEKLRAVIASPGKVFDRERITAERN